MNTGTVAINVKLAVEMCYHVELMAVTPVCQATLLRRAAPGREFTCVPKTL